MTLKNRRRSGLELDMRTVQQTILTPPSGNCLSACIASILEVPLYLVPNFAIQDRFRRNEEGEWEAQRPGAWWKRLCEYCKEQSVAVLQLALEGKRNWAFVPDGPSVAVATIKSLAGDYYHCVVADPESGKVVWDPSPLGKRPEGTQLYEDDVLDWLILVRSVS